MCFQSFSEHESYSSASPICRIREDHEPVEFKRCFTDWREKLVHERSITKRYSAGNVGKRLYIDQSHTYILDRQIKKVKKKPNVDKFDKFDKFIFIISKRSQTNEENTCRIILYTLSLKNKLHTCIIPCNTTLVRHVDKRVVTVNMQFFQIHKYSKDFIQL